MSNLAISDELLLDFNKSFDDIIKIRGEPNAELDQYFVSKETSLKRSLITDPENYTKQRIILLGDMDLVSLGIGIISKPKDLAVLDIDKRVSEIALKMKFDYKIRSIRFINHDIRIRMLAILKDQFDYIFIEPPMTEEGLEVGLSRAVQCAKKEESTRIFLSFNTKDGEQLIEKYTEKMNLSIEDVKKSFNKYDYETPLQKKISDFYILKVYSNSKETIPHHYFGPMYFRESITVPYPYECKCGQILYVGLGGKYKTIEELKEKGCPECGYSQEFRYASTIMLE